ncbi:PREDICTED: cohesin subunit SA-3 [Gekko japonicus]|uniref:Cohesin subunit SA n=1 Tax=Gekko japonicus TaxID=146911 RepID=A0ABM1JR23_GEKJA|nr:PREDICTED: cohesin subunit SA-3 [Gekko japonicus]
MLLLLLLQHRLPAAAAAAFSNPALSQWLRFRPAALQVMCVRHERMHTPATVRESPGKCGKHWSNLAQEPPAVEAATCPVGSLLPGTQELQPGDELSGTPRGSSHRQTSYGVALFSVLKGPGASKMAVAAAAGGQRADGSARSPRPRVKEGLRAGLLLGELSVGVQPGSAGEENASNLTFLRKGTQAPHQHRGRRVAVALLLRKPALGQGAKRLRREARQGRDAQEEEEEPRGAGNLFEALRLGKSATESVVDEWLESYKEDRELGFLELINFLVQSCGCRGVVTHGMLKSLQNSQIIQQLTESFDEDSAEYPLSLSTPAWRRFQRGFCEVMATLVHHAQYDVVYDEYLMDSLIALLTGMSDSQVRAFRHTSTLAAMKLMTGLVRVALSVSLQKDNSQRQYEAEQAKGLNRRAPEKLEGLLEQRREFQEKQEELENLMNAIFKGIFVHRYRDLVPEIRSICIEEMGQWIQHYSASFLTDGYLKYVGWTLHDKQGEVRLRCLLALQGLYRNQEMASRMELFTSRFKERMVSMALDKEPQVAVEAVRLLTLILQNMEDVLTDSDCESIFPLVYASSRPLAVAAGEFLYKKLLAPEGGCARGDEEPREGARAFLRQLLSFFMESEFHDHAAYLVDSLWDCAAPLLKDWQVLTGLLLEEPPAAGFSDQQESALIMTLVASMRQATEGQPPVGRASGKKALTARERKTQAEDRLRLTQHLIPLLPQLLAKFSTDVEKVVPLLEAPCYFDLKLYSTGRLEKYLELLVAQLWTVVEKHTDKEVLETAARTLSALCCPEFAFFSRVDSALSRFVDHLADKFQHEAAELLQSSLAEEEVAYSLAATLRRIAVFHSAHDLTPWCLFEPCIHLLRHAVDTGEVPKQVVIPAMTCSHFSLLWELAHLSNSTSSGPHPSQVQLLGLKEKVASFCSLCQSCLVDDDSSVQEQAFVLLSDLLLIFGPQLARGGRKALEALVYQAESTLQSQLSGFLVDHVFSHAEASEMGAGDLKDEELQIEQLHQRRSILAGFCKLIVYGVVELSAASDVFKHYAKFYSDYGDIIKETLNRARQIDRTEWAHTLLLSLQQMLTQLLLEQGPAGVGSSAFLEIRDLARRFSLLFGLHRLQNRSALVQLHRDGIKFAFQEPASPSSKLGLVNLPLLELLSEFSPRLLHPDKALLLSYLKTVMSQAHAAGHRGELCWASVAVYQHSLSPQVEAGPEPGSAAKKRLGSAAKRRRLDESSELGSSSLPSGSRLQTPLLTSTALKGKQPLLMLPVGSRESSSESALVQRQPPLTSQHSHDARQSQQDGSGLGSRLDRLILMEDEEEVEEQETSGEEEEVEAVKLLG